MCKKVVFLISFVLVLVLAGIAPSAEFMWDKGGADNLWSAPENWDPNGVPTAADTAQINIPGDANKCIIDSSVTAECSVLDVGYNNGPCYLNMTGGTLTIDGNLQIARMADSNGVFTMSGGTVTTTSGRLWVGYNSFGTLIMTGGELNIYNKVEIGKNVNGNGVIYMQGGTINFAGESTGTDFEIATYGTGTVYMTGGVINVEDYIKLAQGNASTTTGVARLYLYGGTINANNLRDPDQIYGDPKVDITEGMLTLTGNDVAVVNEYINRGWIVAYDDIGFVDVNYAPDPNQTIVTGRMPDPELAWAPTPRNRTTVERGITLDWKPGIYAGAHNVYFGTDFNDVNEASLDNPLNVLVSSAQQEVTYNPGILNLGQTYYWRVDEVNDLDPNSPWKGSIWEFTIVDYLVVDDFESYNEIPNSEPGSNLVYYTWTDGYADPSVNGAVIGYLVGDSLETEKVHGGKKAVPLAYSNITAASSEVTVNPGDLTIGNDWTIDNLKVLSLWFSGGQFNAAELMYMKLNGVKVAYSGQPTDLQQPTWQEWTVDLAAFNTDLSNVTEFGIGFERADAFGGRGTIIIDDIRLYENRE
jgi:hypothetical protein